MSLALAVLAVLGLSGAAQAASLTLTPAQTTEALRIGERSLTAESFDAEWRVAGHGEETVTVLTPFHRLVIAARHAAFRKEQLKPGEPARLLREHGPRLVFWASLRGAREDFARLYTSRLVVGDREIKPAFVQNERTAVRQEDGAFLARCVYGFPTKNLAGTARLALVVADGDGRDVSRFAVDLSAMR